MSKLLSRQRPGLCATIDYIFDQNYTGGPQIGRKMLNRRLRDAKILYGKDLYAHYGCVNAVEFSNDGEYLVSGGDDKRVLLWNVNKALSGLCKPKVMKGEHNSNIFCLSFDAKHTRLFSAGNDEQVILHDVNTGETSDVFLHDEAVYGLSVDPINENIFASACDDGRVLIWDVRSSSNEAFTLAGYGSAFHAVMYNPAEPRLLATANSKEGVGLWDIRNPRSCVIRYGRCSYAQSAMSVCFNKRGTHILALRRRLPAVLYEIRSSIPVAEFDNEEYYNSCTMKSCCFAGENDQYVLSGSDDFKLYMWKVPEDSTKKSEWVNKAHLVVRGHRSIVNQVRYNSTFGILASSGVEKIIKLWSTFNINGRVESNYITDKDGLRRVYSHEEYINLILESGQFMTHDYSHHCVQEDPRMMAFFDSLVQRDIEGWTSSDSSDATTNTLNTCYEVQSTDSSSTSSSSPHPSWTSDDDSDRERLNAGLLALTQRLRANLHENPLSPISRSGSSRENQTSDRISKLIAKKRRESCRNRVANKCKKHKKESKTLHSNVTNSCVAGVPSVPNNEISLDSAREIYNKIREAKQRQENDRRKVLRKKRSKLLRFSCINDDSSDSDVPGKSVEVPIPSVELDPNLENRSVPSENGTNHEENTTNISPTSVNNGVVEYIESAENGFSTEMPCGSRSSTSGPNGSGSSGRPFDSSNSLFFQPKSAKHHARNYRKRSAEDMQEDY